MATINPALTSTGRHHHPSWVRRLHRANPRTTPRCTARDLTPGAQEFISEVFKKANLTDIDNLLNFNVTVWLVYLKSKSVNLTIVNGSSWRLGNLELGRNFLEKDGFNRQNMGNDDYVKSKIWKTYGKWGHPGNQSVSH